MLSRTGNQWIRFVEKARGYTIIRTYVNEKVADGYNPGLMFRFDRFALAAKAILGKGDERLDLDFKNSEYPTSLLFPDRIHYINFGYGYSSIKDTMTTRKYDDYLGGEISFHSAFGRHDLDLIANFEQQRQDNTNDLKSTKIYGTRSTYWQQTAEVRALLHLVTDRHIQKIQWAGTLVNGYDGMIDFSPELSRVNYEVIALDNSLHYGFTSISNGTRGLGYTLGLDLRHTMIRRQDHAVSVDVENTFMTVSPSVQLRIKGKDRGEIHVNLQPTYRFSLSDNLGYAENTLNPYIRNVVFMDHHYYRLSSLGTQLRAEWLTRQIAPQYLMGLNMYYGFDRQLSGRYRPIAPLNGSADDLRKRHSLSLGIALYL